MRRTYKLVRGHNCHGKEKVEIDKSLVLESTSRVSLLFCFFVLFVLLFRLDESSHNVSLLVKIN